MRSARTRTVSPAAVSSMPVPLRSNRGTPSADSSRLTARVTAEDARNSDSAPRRTPPAATTALKTWR